MLRLGVLGGQRDKERSVVIIVHVRNSTCELAVECVWNLPATTTKHSDKYNNNSNNSTWLKQQQKSHHLHPLHTRVNCCLLNSFPCFKMATMSKNILRLQKRAN